MVRAAALERLGRLTTELTGDPKAAARRERLTILAARVQNLRRGVFAPWSQRSAVRAILVPFGGAGAIALLDFLANFGV